MYLKSLFYFSLGLGLLLSGCDDEAPSAAAPGKDFSYNAGTGKCLNAKGATGFNVLNLAAVRITKDCECMDLSGQKLVYLLDTAAIENFQELGYNEITGYNFKGARFEEAELFFNMVHEADFSGADLSKIAYGYATLHGMVDAFTKLPQMGCTATDQQINCFN